MRKHRKRQRCAEKLNIIKTTVDCDNTYELTEEEKQRYEDYRIWLSARRVEWKEYKKMHGIEINKIGTCDVCGSMISLAGLSRHPKKQGTFGSKIWDKYRINNRIIILELDLLTLHIIHDGTRLFIKCDVLLHLLSVAVFDLRFLCLSFAVSNVS